MFYNALYVTLTLAVDPTKGIQYVFQSPSLPQAIKENMKAIYCLHDTITYEAKSLSLTQMSPPVF